MRIVLVPCRIRINRISPTGDENLTFVEPRPYLDAIAPNRTPGELTGARAICRGSYIGVIRSGRTGKPVQFSLWNADMSNRIDEKLLRTDPGFPERVLAIFRVDSVDWGASVQELDKAKAN